MAKTKPTIKLTEKTVQNALHTWLEQKGYDTIVPNYTAPFWWEADLYALSKSLCSWEFEIKLTKSDFRQDAKKGRPYRRSYGRPLPEEKTKHGALAARHPHGPNRFSYVAPKGMIAPEELPEWAGLLEIEEGWGRLRLGVAVKAPRLHSEKVDASVPEKVARAFYYRFWSLRQSLKGLPEGHELQDPLDIILPLLAQRQSEEADQIAALVAEAFKDYYKYPEDPPNNTNAIFTNPD